MADLPHIALAVAELAGREDLVQQIEKELPAVPRCKGCGSKSWRRTRQGRLACFRCGKGPDGKVVPRDIDS